MKFYRQILTLLAVLQLVMSAHAQSTLHDLDELHLNLNQWLGFYANGAQACEDMPAQCAVPENASRTPVTEPAIQRLLPMVTHISESGFFNRAATEQYKFLSCDVRQLRLMTAQDQRSIAFQQEIIDEIAEKLPALRQLYAVVEPARQRMIQLRHSGEPGSIRDAAHQALTNRMIDEISHDTADETSLFNTILSSIWRSDDVLMHDFVMRAVISKKSPDEFRREAIQAEANDGLVARMLGYDEFSLKEQVLGPMLEKASTDVSRLGRASLNGHGGGYEPALMTHDLRATLVERSNYATLLNEQGDAGNREAAVFMCNMDRRYISGPQAGRSVVVGASSLVAVGGVMSGALGFARMVRGLSPATYRGLLSASNVAVMSSVAMVSPVLLDQIKSQCFPSIPQHLATSGPRVCDERNVENFLGLQKQKINEENCALNALVVGAGAVPWSSIIFRTVGPALRDKLALSRTLIAQRNAQMVEQQRLAEAQAMALQRSWVRARPAPEPVPETIGEEIVVRGVRRTERPRRRTP